MVTQLKLQLILGFFGLFIAFYLYSVKLFNLTPICGVSECDIVNKSSYSYFLGLAVAVWGIMYYTIIIIVSLEILQAIKYESSMATFLWRKFKRINNVEKFISYIFAHPGKIATLLFGEEKHKRINLRNSYIKRLIDANIFLCSAGLLYSIYLTMIEAFVIKAFCQWCLVSAWITICLFVLSTRVVKKRASKV